MSNQTKSIIVIYLVLLFSIVTLGIYVRWLHNVSNEVYCQTATIAQQQDDNKYSECLR